MVTARIETGVVEEGSQKLSHRHRSPYHDNGQTHEPFQQVDLVGAHQVD